MSEELKPFSALAFERGHKLVRMAEREFPELDKMQLVLLFAVGLGISMGEESFPDRPFMDMENLAVVMGSAAGVSLRKQIEIQKQGCRGTA